jgi:hypothetical protein
MDDSDNTNRLYWLGIEKTLVSLHKTLNNQRVQAEGDGDQELGDYLSNAQTQVGCAIEVAAERATTLSQFLTHRA